MYITTCNFCELSCKTLLWPMKLHRFRPHKMIKILPKSPCCQQNIYVYLSSQLAWPVCTVAESSHVNLGIPYFPVMTISSSNLTYKSTAAPFINRHSLTASYLLHAELSLDRTLVLNNWSDNMSNTGFAKYLCLSLVFCFCCSRAMPATRNQEDVNNRPVIGKLNALLGLNVGYFTERKREV